MKENSPKNSIISGLAWKFGERVLAQGVSFCISLVLARLLSPDDYGVIALVLIFINLAAVFISSGFATALIQKKDADATDFSTMFFCSLVCSVIIYFVIFLAAPLVAIFYEKVVLTKVLRVFALQIPLSVYNSIQNAYVSRHMLFRKYFVATMISTVLSGAVGIGLALTGAGVWALVAQSVTATIISTVVLAIILPWHPEWKFSTDSAKSMMKYGSRILAADLSGTFFSELRSIIIGRVYSSADLAYYTKGQQIPTLITNNLSTSVMTVLFPAMSNESDNIEYVKQMAKRSLRILSYALLPVLFGLAAVMSPLVTLLYTEKWAECIPYAQVLCIGSGVGVFGIIPLQTIKAIGRSDVVMKLEVWKKPVYVLLLILGVRISVFAIAATMVLYDFYGTFVNMLQMKKYLRYGIIEQLRDLLPAFALSGIMAVVVVIIPTLESLVITLAVKVLVGVVIYIGGSILFKMESFQYIKKMLMSMLRK